MNADTSRRRFTLGLAATAAAGAAAAGAGLMSASALAQTPAWPSKPIRILVGYAAGGAVDVIARAIGQKLSADLGQPVLVENKPGAGSNIAIKSAIDSPADGYTLLMAANAVAANMALYQPQPFDAERDLVAVSLVGRVPVVIAVNPASPYKTLAQLIEAAKAKPDSIAFATPGNGSTPHLAVEFFARAASIRLQHIAYRGGTPAITDVIGGQVPMVAVNALEVLPHVKSGKLRVLAALSSQRATTLPDVPTIAESGFPGFEASVWYGLMAPAATPAAIVASLHAATQRALASPEVRERLTGVGGEVVTGTQPMFASYLHSERVHYEKLIREGGIKPD